VNRILARTEASSHGRTSDGGISHAEAAADSLQDGQSAIMAGTLGSFEVLGRRAEYRYYNMDATVANALTLADRLLEEAK
jgi:hypothetical protein